MKPISAIIGGRDTVVVDKNASVMHAARVMSERNIGAVPVLDGERVVGIFSERDIMARVVAAGRDPARTLVVDVMSSELVVVKSGDTHETCLRLMQQARVRHVLVLDEGKLVGIVSLRDLMAVELTEKDEAINLLNAYVHYIPADLAR
ncbi:MAG: CBS domain-containing protein [Acidobacteria bacterium]|nr:CBS domain-containing protein [Acidobacteriota bacterium]